MEKLDSFWWCIDNYSRRDQLSFDYALWKMKVSCEYILPKEYNTNNTSDFDRIDHTRAKTRIIDYKLPWLMRYLNKVPLAREEIKGVYYRIYALPFPHFWSFVLGQLYRVKYFLIRHKNKA